ncbi:uncharacterized protein V1516DRAFT_682928 [Lipomyces oligophaga]|uniref:uncharacterized protein n=1 Tax=Lipomyces oligophaga TaxID=45792 RepID=UPI0034CFB7F7
MEATKPDMTIPSSIQRRFQITLQSLSLREATLERLKYVTKIPKCEGEREKIHRLKKSKAVCVYCRREFICNAEESTGNCCEKSANGCHVFETIDPGELAMILQFKKSPERNFQASLSRHNAISLKVNVIHTTLGLEADRVMILNVPQMELMFDQKIQVLGQPLTLSHSAITKRVYEENLSPKLSIDQVREIMFQKYLDSETLILGHGLSVDLTALRIIHSKVIDCKVLYYQPSDDKLHPDISQADVLIKLAQKYLDTNVIGCGSQLFNAQCATRLVLRCVAIKDNKLLDALAPYIWFKFRPCSHNFIRYHHDLSPQQPNSLTDPYALDIYIKRGIDFMSKLWTYPENL